MAKKAANRGLTDQLRDAIDGSDMSRYAICGRIGMSQATMSRFMNGRGGLSMDILDRIADVLGLRLVVESPADAQGAKRTK